MPKGYRLPGTIDPEDTACMKLYYPNAPEYLAAIWGTLGYLTQWTAWERDSSGSAAAAAALWKDAIAFSRAEFEAERLCNYEAEPEYPASDDGSEELADFLWATKVIIEQIDTILDAGGTYLEFKTWALGEFGVFVGDAFSDLWDDMEGMTSTERDNAIAAIPWQDAYDGTYCEEIPICGEGTYVTQYYCWGQAIIDALSDTAADLADDILVSSAQAYDALKDAMGGYTVKPFSNAFHGYGNNFSFTEPLCLWEHTINLTVSDGGFYQFPSPWDAGVWSSGTGWMAELHVPDTYRNMHYIQLDFPDTATIHNVVHNYSLTKGDWISGDLLAYAVRLQLSSSYVFLGWEKSYNWCQNRAAYNEEIDIGGIDSDKVELFCCCSRGYDYTSGIFNTHSVTITGSGDNPWG